MPSHNSPVSTPLLLLSEMSRNPRNYNQTQQIKVQKGLDNALTERLDKTTQQIERTKREAIEVKSYPSHSYKYQKNFRQHPQLLRKDLLQKNTYTHACQFSLWVHINPIWWYSRQCSPGVFHSLWLLQSSLPLFLRIPGTPEKEPDTSLYNVCLWFSISFSNLLLDSLVKTKQGINLWV